jgi:hypothetical protein
MSPSAHPQTKHIFSILFNNHNKNKNKIIVCYTAVPIFSVTMGSETADTFPLLVVSAMLSTASMRLKAVD